MLYAIHCLDHPNAVGLRLANYEAHKSHLSTASVRSVVSGPLLAEDGETMIGSLFIVEAGSLGDVRAFVEADPFRKAGVWSEIEIHRFHLRVDNRA